MWGICVFGDIVAPLNKQILEPPSPGLLVLSNKFLSCRPSQSFLLRQLKAIPLPDGMLESPLS